MKRLLRRVQAFCWTVVLAVAGTAVSLLAPAAPASAVPPSFVPFIGTLMFQKPDNAQAACSASYITSPSGLLVLTAAHCIYDVGFSDANHNIAFLPGSTNFQPGDANNFQIWPAWTAAVPTQWVYGRQAAYDYAFIVVQPVTIGSTTWKLSDLFPPAVGTLTLAFSQSPPQTLLSIGYPDSTTQKYCQSTSSALGTDQIEMSCPNFEPGASGAPLILNWNESTMSGTVVSNVSRGTAGGDIIGPRFDSTTASLYNSVASLNAPAVTAPATWP